MNYLCTRFTKREALQTLRQAHALYEEEKFARAYNLLSRLQKFPSSSVFLAKTIKLRLLCLLKVGNVVAATNLIETVEENHSNNAIINFTAAGFANHLGMFSSAQKLFKRAFKMQPDNIKYSLAYSQFLREYNRPNQAISVLVKTLRNHKKVDRKNVRTFAPLFIELAQLYSSNGNVKRSLVLLRQTSKTQTHFSYFDLIADCYLHNSDYYNAIKFIKLHLEQWGENDPEALLIFAKGLTGMGYTDEAIQVLEKCRDIWGELVITAIDMKHLYPLLQNGSLSTLVNTVIEL